MQHIPRILMISRSDSNWNWLSDGISEHFMLVRETGELATLSERLAMAGPNIVLIDFSPQPDLEASQVSAEINEIAPDLPIVALGEKTNNDALVTALRAGVKEFIDLASAPGEIIKVLSEIAKRAPTTQTQGLGRATVLLGARQGAGVTTLAVNLAKELNQGQKDKTLLLDFGLPLADGLIHLPCEEQQGAMDFVECVRSLKRFDASLAKNAFLRHTQTGLAVLSLPRNLADLRDISASDGLKFVNLIKSYFENIVIDLCGFSNLEFVASLLRSAETILLVTPQSVPGVVTASEMMKALSDKGLNTENFQLVINPYSKDVALTPEAISSKLKIQTTWTLPDRSAQLTNAVNEGNLLCSTHPKDPYSKAASAIANHLRQAGKKHNNPSVVSKLKEVFTR